MSRPSPELLEVVDRALREDLGGDLDPQADVTTRWTVAGDLRAQARIFCRQPGVVAGVEAAALVFERLDPRLAVEPRVIDGDALACEDTVLRLRGPAAAILVGERTALNLLQQLSGVATLTRAYVEAVAGTATRITETRKTWPGLRCLQKHAVRCGGGVNHRFGLHDAVLIKENHALAAGGVVEAVRRARQGAAAAGASGLRVMCEAETVEEVRHLVESGAQGRPDRILLDNMPPERMAQCVTVIRAAAPQIQIEATGSIGLEAARTVAETGVDLISVGALTHSAPALDLSLLVEAD